MGELKPPALITSSKWAFKTLWERGDEVAVVPEDDAKNDGYAIGLFRGPDREANAQATSAVPDMIDALEMLLAASSDLQLTIDEAEAREFAEAALEKAKGESK